MTISRELEQAGIMNEVDKKYQFQFNNFDKQYESFYGKTFFVVYFLRVSIKRSYGQSVSRDCPFAVIIQNTEIEQLPLQELKLEVGIEECLHIEFMYNKNKYSMKDIIQGRVQFMLVKIRIKYMEICIIKKEVTGQGEKQNTDNETLVKYEIMDGCPTKGEVIPIRVQLSGIDLSPSYKNSRYQVKHFINLVLIDEEERRYFKQQEINIIRQWKDNIQLYSLSLFYN